MTLHDDWEHLRQESIAFRKTLFKEVGKMTKFGEGFRSGLDQGRRPRPRRQRLDPYTKGYLWGKWASKNLLLLIWFGCLLLILITEWVWDKYQ